MNTFKEKLKGGFAAVRNTAGKVDLKSLSLRQKLVCGGALTAIAVIAVVIGITAKPLDMGKDLVVCSNGQVIERPWQITVDGKTVAVLESKEAGEAATEGILDGYKIEQSKAAAKAAKTTAKKSNTKAAAKIKSKAKNKAETKTTAKSKAKPKTKIAAKAAKKKAAAKKGNIIKEKKTLELDFKEAVAVVKSDMKSGDAKPDFMTADQANDKLLKGNKGRAFVTVVAVEQVIADKAVAGKKKIQKTKSLYVGQKKVKVKGHKGRQLITYKIIRENGKIIKTKVIARKVIKKSKASVILTGTKKRDGVYTASRGGGRDSGANLSSPLSGYGISSGFGYRWGAMHYGLDMTSGYGAAIHAAGGGTVISAGYSGSYGNIVKISHGNGVETYYAHCSSMSVSAGQRVSRGQTIAAMGATGNATGPHLHFEVRINGSAVNPASYI